MKSLNIPMDELTTSFLTYSPGGSQSSSENPFVVVREILEWYKECWDERQREEDEAKRQR